MYSSDCKLRMPLRCTCFRSIYHNPCLNLLRGYCCSPQGDLHYLLKLLMFHHLLSWIGAYLFKFFSWILKMVPSFSVWFTMSHQEPAVAWYLRGSTCKPLFWCASKSEMTTFQMTRSFRQVRLHPFFALREFESCTNAQSWTSELRRNMALNSSEVAVKSEILWPSNSLEELPLKLF